MYTFSLARKRTIQGYIIEIRGITQKTIEERHVTTATYVERLHTLAISVLVFVIITRGIGNFGISLFSSHRLNQDLLVGYEFGVVVIQCENCQS